MRRAPRPDPTALSELLRDVLTARLTRYASISGGSLASGIAMAACGSAVARLYSFSEEKMGWIAWRQYPAHTY